MEKRNLDTLLGQLRSEATPAPPERMIARVLRAARASASAQPLPILAEMLQIAFRPQMAVAVLIMTISLGTATTALALTFSSRPPEMSANALGFGIISDPHCLECHHPSAGQPFQQ